MLCVFFLPLGPVWTLGSSGWMLTVSVSVLFFFSQPFILHTQTGFRLINIWCVCPGFNLSVWDLIWWIRGHKCSCFTTQTAIKNTEITLHMSVPKHDQIKHCCYSFTIRIPWFIYWVFCIYLKNMHLYKTINSWVSRNMSSIKHQIIQISINPHSPERNIRSDFVNVALLVLQYSVSFCSDKSNFSHFKVSQIVKHVWLRSTRLDDCCHFEIKDFCFINRICSYVACCWFLLKSLCTSVKVHGFSDHTSQSVFLSTRMLMYSQRLHSLYNLKSHLIWMFLTVYWNHNDCQWHSKHLMKFVFLVLDTMKVILINPRHGFINLYQCLKNIV